jgi:cytochrome P450
MPANGGSPETDRPGAPLATRLTDPDLYLDDPFPLYASLRAHAPLAWHPGSGFWAVSTHPEVVAVSTDPGTFSSAQGILVEEIGSHYESPPTMMHTDPPAHTRYRRMVQPGFKPTVIRNLEPRLRQLGRQLVERIPADRATDVVADVAVPFPLQIISELLGVPADEWPRFLEWSEAVVPGTVDWPEERKQALQAEMVSYLVGVAKARRTDPRHDLVSAIATSQTDGEPLSDDELAMFLVQLLVAGNETTRNLISGGLVALAERPDQWDRLRHDRDLVPSAVEELLRWTTPVISFMRTATRDVELRGQTVRRGEPLLLLYASANRDEEVFGPSADQLDVGRDPNPHVSFGFGPHFCLGAALGRLEGRVIVEELLRRFDEVAPAGTVERAPSPVIAGVRRALLVFHEG